MAKLLIVTTVSITAETFLLPFARYFREKGWGVDAAARGAESSALCGQTFDNCYEMKWTRSPLDAANLIKSAGRIKKLAEQNQYDIVHVHTPIAAFITRFALRAPRAAGKVRVVYTAHGFHFYKGAPAFKSFVFKTAEKIAASWTDHLIVINSEDYEAALRMLPREKVTLTAGGAGLELEKYRGVKFSAEEIAAARAEMGAGKDETLVLMIAEFSRGKRHKDLVLALELADDPGIRLAFAGTGPLMEEARTLAESKGFAEKIKFLGFRGDIPLLIAAADATALPSEREGLPRVVMESMACGTPVIGTDIRGIRDLLAGGCGMLVPVGDIKALAAALKKHKTKTAETCEIARRAKVKAETFEVEKIIARYDDIYKSLLPVPEEAGLASCVR